MLGQTKGGDRQALLDTHTQHVRFEFRQARQHRLHRLATPAGEVIAITGTERSIIASGPCSRSAPENAIALR